MFSSMTNHPRGLYTLFLTEMWERFSYYGMRALLVLFMTSMVTEGGLGFDDVTATAIYGLYTAFVYLTALPGGWIADRLIGAQRAIWYGGIIIMCGHFILAIPAVPAFFIGLIFVVLGTGLLKPNVSAVVGELYPAADTAARDAGYTIFYIGINLGGMLGPLFCSTLGESDRFGWHYGFAAAGFGMLIGLIQFRKTRKYLGEAGLFPVHLQPGSQLTAPKYGWIFVWGGLGVIVLLTVLALTGTIKVDALFLARSSTYSIITIATLYFAYIFVFGNLNNFEKKRIVAIIILLIGSAVFWSGFEQAGSSLNLFAERFTDRILFGMEIPAGWLQSLNAMFILILAPFFAALWVNLGRRNLNPSFPVKFAFGLISLGMGFLVMVIASGLVIKSGKVLPAWLLLTYLFHSMGELCLSPIGLSSVSQLAPKRFMSQMMGMWALALSLGNLIAGLLAGRFDPDSLQQMPGLYLQIVTMAVGTGLLLLFFSSPIRKLMADEHE